MSTKLEPGLIPKFKTKLAIPPVYKPEELKDPETGKIVGHSYVISMTNFKQQLLPKGFPKTPVWGYEGNAVDKNSGMPLGKYKGTPGATFEAIRGIPSNVQWVNNIDEENPLPVDPTIHWADPNDIGMIMPDMVPPFPPGLPAAQKPVPLVTHLHGGEVNSIFDGHPEAWFTHGEKDKGSEFVTSLYQYPNSQPSTTLWYHDHALGITRLNVLMGLAGFYIIRDMDNPLDHPGKVLPDKRHEIPLVIQDRSFNDDGTFNFPNVGVNPDIHPYWQPEFFGDVIMVNGTVWPDLSVDRAQYRFRVLNGSSARFYNLIFSNHMEFLQIGTDGGYLETAVRLDSLLIAPGERADILVDFSFLKPGEKITLENTANAPFPDGDPPDPLNNGIIIRFSAKNTAFHKPKKLPEHLNHIPRLHPNVPKRTLVLFEVEGPDGPVEVLLNGQNWSAPITELPMVGSTEIWEIVNLTMDAHPIHLHLVQFQLMGRHAFRAEDYKNDWVALNGEPPLSTPPEVLPVKCYLEGPRIPPYPNETGWKDTVRVNPGEVAKFIIRFAPQDTEASKPGENHFPFNPSSGPGYVWHCHILDHEDNEMMRPYKVLP